MDRPDGSFDIKPALAASTVVHLPERASANGPPVSSAASTLTSVPAGGAADGDGGANRFQRLKTLGYRELVPIVPPKAIISAKSSLNPATLGKVPGVQRDDGWGGLPGWREHVATEADLIAWHAMGAGIGIRRGAVFFIDIDVLDPQLADRIEDAAMKMLGQAPCRIGQAPKRALAYRPIGDVKAWPKITFEDPGRTDGSVGIVEIPAQIVVDGIRALTGRPYSWPRQLPALAELTPVTGEQLEEFFRQLAVDLPKSKRAGTAPVDRSTVDQAGLRGDPALVASAIRALPNSVATFPTYDSMIAVGQALHAALPDDPDLGNELWHDWCSRWEGGDYDVWPAAGFVDTEIGCFMKPEVAYAATEVWA
ncbi:MAG TPA: hypothetical protein VLA00_00860 [Xanthobacteraceae bacterium]|nr:hypothetical protein [Xanthobacteraceae bacterium]